MKSFTENLEWVEQQLNQLTFTILPISGIIPWGNSKASEWKGCHNCGHAVTPPSSTFRVPSFHNSQSTITWVTELDKMSPNNEIQEGNALLYVSKCQSLLLVDLDGGPSSSSSSCRYRNWPTEAEVTL